MQTTAPGAKAPNAKAFHAGHTLRQEETPSWVREFLSNNAYRTRRNRLPLTWTLIVGASLPFGIWTSSETPSRADSPTESRTNIQTHVSSPHSVSPHSSTSSVAAPDTIDSAASSIAPTIAPSTTPQIAPPATTPGVTTPNVWENAREKLLDLADPLSKLPLSSERTYEVRAIVAGQTRSARVPVPVQGASVGDVLLKINIKLGPLDRVTPLAQANAFDGMTVRVTRVASPLQKRRIAVPFETRYQPTTEIGRGETKTLQSGRSGAIEITERVWSVDGKVSKREFVSRRLSRQAQPRIIGLGTRGMYLPGRIPYHNRYARSFSLSARAGSPRDRFVTPSDETYRATRSIRLVATGYSPDPSENGGYTVTCTGLPIGYGAAAVDPRVIPLGTKLYVEGYGYAFACDTGGAIKGHRIDLAYDSYGVANSKGHKAVRVWILER